MFTADEGADAHCQLNNPALLGEVACDWLEDVFGGPADLLAATPG